MGISLLLVIAGAITVGIQSDGIISTRRLWKPHSLF